SAVFIVDTNFVLSHLRILDEMVVYAAVYRHVVVFPWTVIKELDGLKNSTRVNMVKEKDNNKTTPQVVGQLARRAGNWLFQLFARTDPGVRGQKKDEKLEEAKLSPDDSILDCCRFFRERTGVRTILLSNDRNLCVKALVYSILTVTYVPGLTAQYILNRILLPSHLFPES
ncbi:PIN domain-containing protein, partial [Dipodascopsis tothii]|uniref:PIN domain-containing protein n=1 Tax=Dipodascopsis tothii TaxID=44089 RepID=UPI0034CE9204